MKKNYNIHKLYSQICIFIMIKTFVYKKVLYIYTINTEINNYFFPLEGIK